MREKMSRVPGAFVYCGSSIERDGEPEVCLMIPTVGTFRDADPSVYIL